MTHYSSQTTVFNPRDPSRDLTVLFYCGVGSVLKSVIDNKWRRSAETFLAHIYPKDQPCLETINIGQHESRRIFANLNNFLRRVQQMHRIPPKPVAPRQQEVETERALSSLKISEQAEKEAHSEHVSISHSVSTTEKQPDM